MDSKNNNQPQSKTCGIGAEIARYLLFGVLTTVVSMVSNFAVLWGGKAIFGVSDTTSLEYLAVYSTAKVVSWFCAVIFAFFTNKKWVFHDKTSGGGVAKQFGVFACGRILTLGLDYVLNFVMIRLMSLLALAFLDGLFGQSLDTMNELIAWFVTQVFVVAANYFISKLFVFRNKQ